MVNKIDIKPAVLDSGSTVGVQILKYVDGELSEDNTYSFDANDFEANESASNPYTAIINFGTVHSENINGNTTQFYFDGVVCSPNNAYTLAGLVRADVTAYASGGGGYTFPSNSGNTAYVSSGGNDGTGVVGNISKPFLTADAAIGALNAASDGTLIILSATSTIEITDYNYTTMPYDLAIQVLCDQALRIGGSSSFGNLGLQTNGEVIINTQLVFATDASMKVNCKTFTIPNTSNGNISYLGVICCDRLVIATNENIGVNADILIWNSTSSVGSIIEFTYNYCTPKTWIGKISQVDTDAPSIDIVLANTFGEALTFARNGLGWYEARSAGSLFTDPKTVLTLGLPNVGTTGSNGNGGIMQLGNFSTGALEFYSTDIFLGNSDNILFKSDVKIETYL